MIYLTGSTTGEIEQLLIDAGVGLMLTPASGYRMERALRHACWAADNGCFARPETFDLARYLAWLERMAPAALTCLFATAPDVWGDWEATWARSEPVLPQLRALGYRAALVAQDGVEHMVDTLPWGAFDALFVGGRDEWRQSDAVHALVREARARGVWCHLGRCNSRIRMRAAKAAGYHSADGTQLVFAPRRRGPQVARWVQELALQPALDIGGR